MQFLEMLEKQLVRRVFPEERLQFLQQIQRERPSRLRKQRVRLGAQTVENLRTTHGGPRNPRAVQIAEFFSSSQCCLTAM